MLDKEFCWSSCCRRKFSALAVGSLVLFPIGTLANQSKQVTVKEFRGVWLSEIPGSRLEDCGESANTVADTAIGSAIQARTSQPIGQPADEEDIRDLFLRQSSVLLLPGQLEIETGIEYRLFQRESTFLNTSYRLFNVPLSLRVGLLDNAESFITLPIAYAQRKLFFSGNESVLGKFGVRDVSLGLKYVLRGESERWPEVVTTIGFTGPTGDDPNEEGVSLGSGHWDIEVGLAFIKVSDPIVFFWGIAYTHQFESRHFYSDGEYDVQPGEAVGYSFGFGFAVNEATSLSSQLVGSYNTEDKVDNKAVVGSSREPILLRLGLTRRWTSRTYIEPAVAAGLTGDAPDATISLSWAYRFGE